MILNEAVQVKSFSVKYNKKKKIPKKKIPNKKIPKKKYLKKIRKKIILYNLHIYYINIYMYICIACLYFYHQKRTFLINRAFYVTLVVAVVGVQHLNFSWQQVRYYGTSRSMIAHLHSKRHFCAKNSLYINMYIRG